jgi:hypothetical protein
MADIINNGGEILGIDVTDAGTLVLGRDSRKGVKVITITNPSPVGMFLALKNSPDPDSPVNQAEVNKGIYLTALGGAYEINETNLCLSEIWAIHADTGQTHPLAVQVCR